ncbi:diguanylate cyclase [Cohnella sp. CFH 77786]|uniref:diguanylate cyclase n=1 Tax=Cohnella sp. CFH 77786 TaxID=2662265 RepID=UPI001C608EB6|nr:diguanylate cyclase [Cohnella sp. CFH 77786]MBW5447297.1 diguanylate cyclase [Cohnella sp. CFH 77786]
MSMANLSNKSDSSTSYVILVAGCSHDIAGVLSTVFSNNGWETHTAIEAEQVGKVYFETKPDCVVLGSLWHETEDWIDIRDYAHSESVPIIFIDDSNSSEYRIRGFNFGANDVLGMPLIPEEVAVRVQRQLEIRTRFQEATLIDTLFGVYKRKYFFIEAERQLGDLRRTRDPFTVVVFELDRFRELNETYGYKEGIRAIRDLGRFINGRIRNTDVLIHAEDEKFILILPRTYTANAVPLIQRLQQEFSAELADAVNGTYSRSFSAGLLEVVDSDWKPGNCLDMAVKALEKAKAEGSNATHVFSLAQDQEQGWRRKLNVAVIDDDELIRNLLESRLQDLGGQQLDLNVKCFVDGEDFFGNAWHKQPGQFLVLLDRNMPRMNGMEVLRKLRLHYDRSRYLVMMLTVVNTEASISQAIESGADDYMTKPFSLIELESRIMRLIKGKRR